MEIWCTVYDYIPSLYRICVYIKQHHKTLSTLYCQSARLSPILQTAVSQNRQREILDGGDCEQREDGEEI